MSKQVVGISLKKRTHEQKIIIMYFFTISYRACITVTECAASLVALRRYRSKSPKSGIRFKEVHWVDMPFPNSFVIF